ncbi:hypothetical protein Poli38472_003632 [Pythium oligandrum]|uniref:Amino acid transporter transmembrane domain-containing protein n=1 Tax=Pythium oligandrum TaxID=41045 RepID=A0A8K1FNH3_PYTOL|nr:hypothetical protein Poli38472_003632 [Pythium oligandrum]|eukprot:TMW65867.1 hypothetical protein Poli38472_003632 [Pythium oligandrum]
MMAFGDDSDELSTRLLSEHEGEEASQPTLSVADHESSADSDYELISARETLVFEDEIRLLRAGKNQGPQSFVQTYLMDKIQPGSVKGSMFTMTVAIVGAGVLSLPYAVQRAGLLLGLLLITGGAVVTNFSLRLLLTCSELTQSRSYMDLAHTTGGPRLAGFTQFVVCLNLFGTSVGYLVGSAELLQLAIKSFAKDSSTSVLTNREDLILILAVFFVLPLALFRSLESLRFTSLFSIFCIVFMALVIVIKYFQFVHLGYAPTISYQLHHLKLFDFRIHRLLTAIPLVIFVYTCHPNVLPIYLVLKRRSSPRMYKVMNRSIGLSATVYALCGAFVVLTFGEHTKSNFLKNDYHHDVAVLIGCIGFSIALILTVPLFIHTLRDNIREALLRNQRLNVFKHAVLSIFLVLAVFVVAEVSGDIASVLGVLGATTNPVICFVLPAYFIYRVGPSKYATHKLLAGTIAVVAIVIGVASVVQQVRAA